jgi:hypothetical protein
LTKANTVLSARPEHALTARHLGLSEKPFGRRHQENDRIREGCLTDMRTFKAEFGARQPDMLFASRIDGRTNVFDKRHPGRVLRGLHCGQARFDALAYHQMIGSFGQANGTAAAWAKSHPRSIDGSRAVAVPGQECPMHSAWPSLRPDRYRSDHHGQQLISRTMPR